MDTQKIRDLIDKVIGKDGPLRAPAYWIQKLFHSIVDEIKKLINKTDKLSEDLDVQRKELSELSAEFTEHVTPKTYPTVKIMAKWQGQHYTGCATIAHFRATISNLSEIFPNNETRTLAYVEVDIETSDGKSYRLFRDNTLRTVYNAMPSASITFAGSPARVSMTDPVTNITPTWLDGETHAQNNLPIKWKYGTWMFCVSPYPSYFDFDFEYITTDVYITNQNPERNLIEVNRWLSSSPQNVWKNVNYCNCIYQDAANSYKGILNVITKVITIVKDGSIYTATYDSATGLVGTFTKSQNEDFIEAIDIEEE